MKILAIRLKNLTSIEGTVEVDFTAEPLHSAGIFAISGPTGAGKSTLLDALCLALYDKAPRFATSVESVNLARTDGISANRTDSLCRARLAPSLQNRSLDPSARLGWSRFHAPSACSF